MVRVQKPVLPGQIVLAIESVDHLRNNLRTSSDRFHFIYGRSSLSQLLQCKYTVMVGQKTYFITISLLSDLRTHINGSAEMVDSSSVETKNVVYLEVLRVYLVEPLQHCFQPIVFFLTILCNIPEGDGVKCVVLE